MAVYPKCLKCGWKYGNFHICVDLTVKDNPPPTTSRSRAPISDEGRANLIEAQNARWERKREEEKERDEAIVARYKQGDVGQRLLAKEFGISNSTVHSILKRSVERGEMVMRQQGRNLRHLSNKENTDEN